MDYKNKVASNPLSVTLHEAVNDLLVKVATAGHNIESVKAISLTQRFNPNSGPHVHATCAIRLRFDVSVTGEEASFRVNTGTICQ